MGWIRVNRRGGALLALAGLVFQLTVALGHVHLNLSLTGAGLKVGAAANEATGSGGHPVRPQSDANCDICAVLHMAAAGEIASAPQLLIPTGYVTAEPAAVVQRTLVSTRHLFPQSRAPPAV